MSPRGKFHDVFRQIIWYFPSAQEIDKNLVMREFLWRWRRTIALAAAVAVVVTLLRLVLPQVVTKPLVVAATDIPPGSIIQAGQVTVKQIPVAALPPQGYKKPSQAVGQRTAVPIAAGTTLFPALFSSSPFSRHSFKRKVILALPLRESDQGLASAGDEVIFFLGNDQDTNSAPDTSPDATNPQTIPPALAQKAAESKGLSTQITAQVLSVSAASGSLTGGQKAATIEVAVNPSAAGRLVQASKSEPLQLARTG